MGGGGEGELEARQELGMSIHRIAAVAASAPIFWVHLLTYLLVLLS